MTPPAPRRGPPNFTGPARSVPQGPGPGWPDRYGPATPAAFYARRPSEPESPR